MRKVLINLNRSPMMRDLSFSMTFCVIFWAIILEVSGFGWGIWIFSFVIDRINQMIIGFYCTSYLFVSI